MNRKRILKTIFILVGLLLLTIVLYYSWFFYDDYVATVKLYNSPQNTFKNKENLITRQVKLYSGFQRAILLAADWSKDPNLGKIKIINKIDFNEHKYRTVLRYVFQEENPANFKKVNPCDREYYLKEIITTSDGGRTLRDRSWKTNECYESGSSPEICLGTISLGDIDGSYQAAIILVLNYLKEIIEFDETFTIQTASYAIVRKGIPEWTIHLSNDCLQQKGNCPKVSATAFISDDGKDIWAIFISGTQEYIKKWKKLEYLNPNRPFFGNNGNYK
jgi:hypothetical protein